MGKIAVLKNIFLIVVLLGVVFMVSSYAEPVKTMAREILSLEDEWVLGASNDRAQEITGKVGSDIAGFAVTMQTFVLQMTLNDIIGTISRAQQIPQDIQSVHTFVKEQANHVLQSVNQK